MSERCGYACKSPSREWRTMLRQGRHESKTYFCDHQHLRLERNKHFYPWNARILGFMSHRLTFQLHSSMISSRERHWVDAREERYIELGKKRKKLERSERRYTKVSTKGYDMIHEAMSQTIGTLAKLSLTCLIFSTGTNRWHVRHSRGEKRHTTWKASLRTKSGTSTWIFRDVS